VKGGSTRWRRTCRSGEVESRARAQPPRETTRLESDGLFIFIGADAETAWLPSDIALASVPGILACGDVRFSPVKRVAAVVGEGSMAIAFVHQYLRESEARAESPQEPTLPTTA
jgi:thioredoxin reductase